MKRNLTASHLKWIALITMLIDHIGAVVILAYANKNGISIGEDPFLPKSSIELAYFITRLIGRLAFPIYGFLIVEGVIHTGNIKNYLTRLGVFAIISEIPFDLASSGQLFNLETQNIFFTLFLGALAVYLLKEIPIRVDKGQIFYKLLVIVASSLVAYLIASDYQHFGVLFIIILFIFKNNPISQAVVAGFMGSMQMTAAFSGIFLYLYNGKKGEAINKYFFYAFYPAHLLLLFGLAQII